MLPFLMGGTNHQFTWFTWGGFWNCFTNNESISPRKYYEITSITCRNASIAPGQQVARSPINGCLLTLRGVEVAARITVVIGELKAKSLWLKLADPWTRTFQKTPLLIICGAPRCPFVNDHPWRESPHQPGFRLTLNTPLHPFFVFFCGLSVPIISPLCISPLCLYHHFACISQCTPSVSLKKNPLSTGFVQKHRCPSNATDPSAPPESLRWLTWLTWLVLWVLFVYSRHFIAIQIMHCSDSFYSSVETQYEQINQWVSDTAQIVKNLKGLASANLAWQRDNGRVATSPQDWPVLALGFSHKESQVSRKVRC